MAKKWICTVCGYVHEGETAPERCPLCKVPADKFKLVEEEALNFACEHEIGVAKGVDEEILKGLNDHFMGECTEVGMYLAMSRQADREGYPEVAEAFKRYAWEEAEHAAQYAELTGKISDCTKTNLTNMMNGEIGANKFKAELAQKAKDAGLEELYTFIDHAARDEARHASMLHGMLNRL